MCKITLFVHVSLDGFVAGPQGEMNWITLSPDLFKFIGARIERTDTALYGHKTYQMMESYWPTAAEQPGATEHDIEHARWYKHARKVVMSNSLSAQDAAGARIIGTDLKAEVDVLKQGAEGEILMFGSPTAAHGLMREDLIDGYWLLVNPVLIGSGIPLFKHPEGRARLRLVDLHAFPSGVVSLSYERA